MTSKKGKKQAANSELSEVFPYIIKYVEAVRSKLQISKKKLSPLQALQAQVEALLSVNSPIALFTYLQLEAAIDGETFSVHLKTNLVSFYHFQTGEAAWKTSQLATSVLLIFAAPKTAIKEALRFCSHKRGGVPTLTEIRKRPTASLREAFSKAWTLAKYENKMTIIGVELTDVHMVLLAEAGKASDKYSFSHYFVLGIAPEGMRVWQAWGEHGYTLGEWLSRDGARVRGWDEADEFVRDFTRLTVGKGVFDAKRNMLYKKCFDIDIRKICGDNGPEKPLTKVFDAHVRLLIFEDVKVADISKFNFL